MSDLIRLSLIFLVIFNPAGLAVTLLDLTSPGRDRRQRLIAASALSAPPLVAAALLGDPLLDALDISLPSFQIATGTLLAVSTLPAFFGDRRYPDPPVESPGWIVTRLALWLASPAALAAAMTYALDRGTGRTLAAILVALALSAGLAGLVSPRLASRSRRALAVWTSRGIAAMVIFIAIDLIQQGVENV